jgi:PTS system mannose-specific IIB component
VIALVRVDNRLVHGQVLVTWVPALGVEAILVADDEAAASPLARAALTLALTPGLRATLEPLGAVDWPRRAASPERTLVVVREVADLERAAAAGLPPGTATLNLGNVHYGRERRAVTPSVFLSAGELAALERLAAAGFRVEARALPADAPLGLDEIRRRFAAAPEAR